MRLWHKDLIPYLPKKQLVGQWREIIAIMRDWEREEKGIEKKGAYAHKHPLVKYVTEYGKEHFYSYALAIYQQMTSRTMKPSYKLMMEITHFCLKSGDIVTMSRIAIYYKHHDRSYLRICYYNLLEKFKSEMIPHDEWQLLCRYISNKI